MGLVYRLIVPFRFLNTVTFRYESLTDEITIPETGHLSWNFTLMRDDPLHWASAYDFGIAENQYNPTWHSDEEIYSIMSSFENKYFGAAKFQAGDNIVSTKIHSIEISHEVSATLRLKTDGHSMLFIWDVFRRMDYIFIYLSILTFNCHRVVICVLTVIYVSI